MTIEKNDKIIDLSIKAFVAALIGLGVAYIKNLGQETANLNLNIVELKAEVRGSNIYQNEINRNFRERFDKLEQRLDSMERKK
jgi:hypothetical protein